MTRRVLIWTESHIVGGCDRYLADLLPRIDRDAWDVTLAGIPNPAYDGWLAARSPADLPRVTVKVATLPGSPLERVRQRVGARGLADSGAAVTAGALPVDEGQLPRRAAVAALRYRQLGVNVHRLRRLLRAERPDVLFVNNGGYPGGESCRAITLAAQREGVPRTVHFVHNMAYPPLWPAGVERALDRRIDRATSVWATAAGRARDALADERGFDPGHIRVVHYGIPSPAPAARLDATDTGFAPGALNVAIVAAFEPRKGHAVLLDALALLRDRGVDVRAALVGAGPAEAAVAKRTMELGLDDRVTRLGWRDDVPQLLAAADALVLPSLGNECLPYAILEAMSHSLPVVSTDVAGIPEAVDDGRTGFVVAPGDAAALAAAMERLARAPDDARAMGGRGAARIAEHFTLERMVEQTVALWS